MSEAIYERALRRMLRFTLAVGAAGSLVALTWRGPRISAGFLMGALLSLVNFYWWATVAQAIGGAGSSSPPRAAVLLSLRYLILCGIIYVIVKVLQITPAAVLAGLLVSVAAVVLEALYELIYARK